MPNEQQRNPQSSPEQGGKQEDKGHAVLPGTPRQQEQGGNAQREQGGQDRTSSQKGHPEASQERPDDRSSGTGGR